MQILTQVVLATQGQNQVLIPQQVLTHPVTLDAPIPPSPVIPYTCRQLHYFKGKTTFKKMFSLNVHQALQEVVRVIMIPMYITCIQGVILLIIVVQMIVINPVILFKITRRQRIERWLVFECILKNAYSPRQVRGSSLSKQVLNTQIPRDYIFTKISLDNYNGLTDLREHVQNI